MSNQNTPLAEFKGIKMYHTDAVSTTLAHISKTPDEVSKEEIEEKFNFIVNENLKQILIRDFIELETCENRELTKSTLVLCGSIIESLLIDQIFKDNILANAQVKFNDIVRSSKPERVDKTPENWWFAEMIDVCEKLELISSETKREVWKLNNYRQIIHPMNEIRTGINITPDLAHISYHVLSMIVDDLKNQG